MGIYYINGALSKVNCYALYLKRKPYNVLFESNTETERISIMRGSRRDLVEVGLFQLRGHDHPQDDATINSEDGQNSKNIFQKTCCTKIPVHQCTFRLNSKVYS